MPASQLLLFYYLYQNKTELFVNEITDMLCFSAMQISRAVKQLTMLGLLSVRKEGVRVVISSNDCRLDLFEKAKPFLLNPIRKKIYVEYEDLPEGLPLSGYSALSELTMLGGSFTKTFAFFGKIGELKGTALLVDDAAQAEVEIWHYNPVLLSRHPGVVDALSLAASLPAGDDERVEQAIDELLSVLRR